MQTEENNRMGKTRDLFKKIRDTKGTFHAKMDLIKDRNDMDLREADEIKKRWQEYTELYKKDLNESQTSWSAKSSGPSEATPGIKLVEVMEFQLSYSKS